MTLGQVAEGVAKQCGSVGVAVAGEEVGQARRAPFGRGYAGYADVVVGHAAAFLHTPLAEQEEGLARGCGYPVGVASAGVEECGCRLAGVGLGQSYKFVFDFERTHALEPLFIVAAFGIDGGRVVFHNIIKFV